MDSSPPNVEKKKPRRSRKDMDDRNFICRYCDKSYLSNAALYTHVKNKHQQKNPTDTPPNKMSELENPIQHQQKMTKKQEIPKGERHLNQLKTYLRKFFHERNKINTVDQMFKDVDEQETKALKSLIEYWATQTQVPDRQKTTINKTIAYFLYLMSNKLYLPSQQFLVRFFANFRQGVIYDTRKRSVCEYEVSNKLPTYFNNVIINGFITSGKYSCEVMARLEVAKKVLECFGNWLYDQKFSDYKTIPN